MRNKLITLTAVIILTLVMMTGLSVPVVASGSQSWNLDSQEDINVPPISPSYLCQMEQTGGPGDNGQSGTVVLTPHTEQIWIADLAATNHVKFGGGDGPWVLELVTDTGWITDGTDCIIEIGEWDVYGQYFRSFTSANQDNPPWIDPIPGHPLQLIITFVWQNLDEVVYKDNYLAIRVTNDSGSEHTIYCGEVEQSSCLTSPGSNPGYPTPHYPPIPVTSVPATAAMIGVFGILSAVILIKRGARRVS
jgi:hypothetical protein